MITVSKRKKIAGLASKLTVMIFPTRHAELRRRAKRGNLTQNQIVDKGDKLGVTIDGKIKFELRQGREPLDPVEWIRIDSFK